MSENPAPTGPEATPPAAADEPKTYTEDYVKGLRDEAAGARVAKRDAVEAAKTETRSEVVKEYEPQLADKDTQISTLTADLATTKSENLKLRAVLASEGVATGDVLELVDLVQGTDEESISASVARVLSVYGKAEKKGPYVDPSQGAGGHAPLNGNKLLDQLKRAVGAE